MSNTTHECRGIVRTERGLTIGGTRITLYALMDYLKAGCERRLILEHFRLNERELNEALAYIDAHHEEVEREYKIVLKQADENRRYWEERNKIQVRQVEESPDPKGLRAKLKTWKAKQSKA